VRALYSGDPPSCERALGSIGEGTPPAALVPFFRAWLVACRPGETKQLFRESSGGIDAADRAVAKLYGRVLTDAHPLTILSEQAEEALRHGMLEHFESLCYRILRDLQEQRLCDGPLLAIRFAVSSLKALDEAGYGDTDFFSVILRALGRSDGFCALALSLMDRDQVAAAAALQGSLEAADGVFVRGSMRRLLERAQGTLVDAACADWTASDGSVAGRIPSDAACEELRRGAVQLELFT